MQSEKRKHIEHIKWGGHARGMEEGGGSPNLRILFSENISMVWLVGPVVLVGLEPDDKLKCRKLGWFGTHNAKRRSILDFLLEFIVSVLFIFCCRHQTSHTRRERMQHRESQRA